MNRVVLIGRLTRDPELRYTTNGNSQAKFTLAVDRDYTNQQGEREADFIPIVAWGKTGQAVVDNLSKGSLVAVDGKMQVRSYEAKDGGRRWITEIVANSVKFLERRGSQQNANSLPTYDEEGNELQEVPF